ncbi:hypothetical protein EVAR_95878_1 [Eumeta japonica]|uniref:Uncharacterized protein n=1 Tax=Eumeta variegata TaxID=151549 RepID=A0A4C1VKB6_EUMVA|nr:hypothetical protein EVAR_95878_1 [Eumeta japonica]
MFHGPDAVRFGSFRTSNDVQENSGIGFQCPNSRHITRTLRKASVFISILVQVKYRADENFKSESRHLRSLGRPDQTETGPKTFLERLQPNSVRLRVLCIRKVGRENTCHNIKRIRAVALLTCAIKWVRVRVRVRVRARAGECDADRSLGGSVRPYNYPPRVGAKQFRHTCTTHGLHM